MSYTITQCNTNAKQKRKNQQPTVETHQQPASSEMCATSQKTIEIKQNKSKDAIQTFIVGKQKKVDR